MPKKTLLALVLVSALFAPGLAHRADRIGQGADGRRSPEPPDARRRADRSRRELGGLHRLVHRLEAGRLRHAGLAGPRAVGAELPGDPWRQVLLEPVVVARRRVARVHQFARRRQEPDLRHPPGRRRGRPAHQRRERRRRLRVVARREADRLHVERPRRRRTSRRAATTWATSRSSAASTPTSTCGRSTWRPR